MEKFGSFSILVAACGAGMYLLSKHVPEPYMDEIFHVPQAQRYCSWNLSYWDPMITTPPGLYLLSLILATPISYILRIPTPDLCTVTFLRGQNLVCTLLLYLVIIRILRHKKNVIFTEKNPVSTEKNRVATTEGLELSAISLCLFPVLFFFSFLYYTDAGATFFFLWGYLLQMKGRHWCAALVLLVSVLFRQTSVVWLVYVAGSEVVTFAHQHLQQRGQPESLQHHLVSMVTVWPSLLLPRLLPYIFVTGMFLIFIVANGSLALGDKKNHTLSFHLPQLFYFSVFSCFFAAPRLIMDWWQLGMESLRNIVRRPCWVFMVTALLLVAMAVVAVVVHFFTYAHPYLLADNRHFPFYLWKNIFRRHWIVRYLLSPVYVLAASALIFSVLRRTRDVLWLLLYAVCCFTALVPQRLLEFRYYIIPYLLFRIQVESGKQPPRRRQQHGLYLLELLFYVTIDLATMALFLYKPFKWPDSQDWQRFMW